MSTMASFLLILEALFYSIILSSSGSNEMNEIVTIACPSPHLHVHITQILKKRSSLDLDAAFKKLFIARRRKSLSNDWIVRNKFWNSIQEKMHRLLFWHGQIYAKNAQMSRETTSIFNQFLKSIQVLDVCSDDGIRLQLMDNYYLWAKDVGIEPDAITFNILLKANRICTAGIRGKLVLAHLNEMIECGIAADSYTIVELLAMCARSPGSKTMNGTMTNKQVADAEFKYYIDNILPVHLPRNHSSNFTHFAGKLPPAYVFNTYLDVYAEDGDINGMRRSIHIARNNGIIGKRFDAQTKNTFHKGRWKYTLRNNSKLTSQNVTL